MNTESTNKTIEKIEGEDGVTHCLTIKQMIDLVKAQRSKTEFFVYAKVEMEVLRGCVGEVVTRNTTGYEGAVQVTRKSLLEMLDSMASRMRVVHTTVRCVMHNNPESGYSALYLC